MKIFVTSILLVSSAIAFTACSKTDFSNLSEGELDSASSLSIDATPTLTISDSESDSASVQATSLPSSSCVDSSNGKLGFKIESSSAELFQTLRITSIAASSRGSLVGYTIHDNGTGTLHYEDQSMEIYIDSESDDFFYSCVVIWSEIVDFVARKGISSVPEAIPRLALKLWLPEDAADYGKIVGIALQNKTTKEFAVQCF